jgi:hypothetical protein
MNWTKNQLGSMTQFFEIKTKSQIKGQKMDLSFS